MLYLHKKPVVTLAGDAEVGKLYTREGHGNRLLMCLETDNVESVPLDNRVPFVVIATDRHDEQLSVGSVMWLTASTGVTKQVCKDGIFAEPCLT